MAVGNLILACSCLSPTCCIAGFWCRLHVLFVLLGNQKPKSGISLFL